MVDGGSGSFAVVREVLHQETGKKFACKIIGNVVAWTTLNFRRQTKNPGYKETRGEDSIGS